MVWIYAYLSEIQNSMPIASKAGEGSGGGSLVDRSIGFVPKDAHHLLRVMSSTPGAGVGEATISEFSVWVLRAESAMKTVSHERIRASDSREERLGLYVRVILIAARHIEKPHALHKPQRTRSRTTRAGSSMVVKLAAGSFFDRYDTKSLENLALPELKQMIADVFRAAGQIEFMIFELEYVPVICKCIK